jgi:hypothetical protein
VVVTHNGPVTELQRMWTALLAAPDGSALCGASAAGLDGLTGFGDAVVHVVIEAGRRRPRLDGARYHWSAAMDVRDVHPSRSPLRTRLPRSVVDLASWAPTADRSTAVVLAAVQQRLVRPAALRDALSRRGPCRWHAVIQESITDAEGGIHSVPERQFSRIVASRGLPPPVRQSVKRRPDGCLYLDAEWPHFGFAVEVHGAQHMEAAQWDADLDRGAEIVADGHRLIALTSFAIRHRQTRVGDLLVRSLRSGGWRG